MNSKLIDSKTIIEDAARDLWQGQGADISAINDTLSVVTDEILSIAELLSEEDKATTISYIKNALSDFKRAYEARDDFLLADCLYYEWREMLFIYIDVSQEGPAMNKYLNKNLQVVKELHNEIKINDKLVSKYESQGEVEPITSYKGYSLCGTIDREHAIEVWCEQFKDLKRNEVAYVFGMGSLDYYERLYELYPELRVVIYEPLEE